VAAGGSSGAQRRRGARLASSRASDTRRDGARRSPERACRVVQGRRLGTPSAAAGRAIDSAVFESAAPERREERRPASGSGEHDPPGRDRPARDRRGPEPPARDRRGRDRRGPDPPGRDWRGRDRRGHDRPCRDRRGPGGTAALRRVLRGPQAAGLAASRSGTAPASRAARRGGGAALVRMRRLDAVTHPIRRRAIGAR
jgi:23S rRNA pseudouridine2605 synthase